MSHYRSDRAHAQFLLFDVLDAGRRYGVAPFEDVDTATAVDLLEHVEAFAHGELADSFAAGDTDGLHLDRATHSVSLPADLRTALAAHVGSDWLRLDLPPELADTHVPPSLRWAATEFILGANPAVAMCSQLIPVVVTLLHRQGTGAQRQLAQLILDRGWTVTMVLTEPDAGSDVGLGRTAACPQPDGTWQIRGTKRFITWADHDAAENVIHLVLARPQGVPGAGGPGTKGLSLFVVPARHYDPQTGQVLERNGVCVANIEHKMGIAGTPTCELVFGDGSPAVATLLGDRHDGIRQMFEIITYVRMMVGLKTIAALSTGHLNAREYAATRRQGRELVSLGGRRDGRDLVEIADHPDIRRSLLTQKAYADGGRALVLYTATMIDRIESSRANGSPDNVAVARHRMLLPIVKTWSAENGWRVLGQECLQVFGGSGYLRDYPIEQYVRDTKIDAIYEGTTGIQALDLFERRLIGDDTQAVRLLLAEITKTADGLSDAGSRLSVEAGLLSGAVAAFTERLALTVETARDRPRVAGLGLTPLLLALGDLIVGWLLLRAAATAQSRLDGPATDVSDLSEDGLRGVVAAGRWFARQVLTRLPAELAAAALLDDEPLTLPVAAL